MITNELQNLGIQNQEIVDLLFVPGSTLRTWFKKATTISSKYYSYISALKIYQSNQKAEDLITIYNTLVKYTNTGQSIWASSNVAKYNDYVIYNTPSGTDDPDAPQDPV